MISPSAVSVADGDLIISTYTSGGTHYTGMISTQETYLYTYGYIEARINFDSNPGMWSAFWMQSPTIGNPIGSPNIAGTEIDICEHRSVDSAGRNIKDLAFGTIHWDGYGPEKRSTGYTSPSGLGLGTGYHLYGMEWTPTQQKFYIDGVLRWTANNTTNSPVSQRSEYIILSGEAENGAWAGDIPAGGYGTLATTTSKMEVDYVRVYRRAETVINGDFEGKISPFITANQATWSATGGRTEPAAGRLAPTSSAGATISQSVLGLLPDTGYTLSAWGNAGTTSPSLFIGAKDYGAAETGQTLTDPTYTQASASFTTSGTRRSATVLARSKNSGSSASVDDFILRRHATVNNGQLESGDDLAWSGISGGAFLSSDGTNYGGKYAWKFPTGTSNAGVEQDIIGLSPSTAYRLTGWTTNGNAGLSFGVKNHGGTQVLSNVSANTWTKGSVNFTTGSASTSATIFASRTTNTQAAYVDSFFLSEPLTAPWVSQDVTDIPLDGTAGRLGDKFVIQSSGAGIGGTSDKMHFISQPITGDAIITARVLGVDHSSLTASTGVMIRETNSSFARSASLTWSPGQTLDFTCRTTGSASSSTVSLTEIAIPPWVRLTRRGNVFTAYSSPDGVAWSRVGTPQTIAMSSATSIGIPTSSGAVDILTESSLDNVTVSTAVPDVQITSPAEGATISGISQTLRLTASITDSGTPAIIWSEISGPGTVTFANASLADTSATFSAPGTYILRCAATTAAGTGSDDHTINVTAATADPSLVLRLKLDESAGTTATDSSGSSNHGTTNGGLLWQTAGGQLTGAAEFNGADSYIAVADSPSLDNTSAFTLSWWFKANTFNNAGLVAKRITPTSNNSYGAFLTVDGKLNVDINTGNDRFTSATTFNLGAWYHIAVVFDGSLAQAQRAKLYVNGTLDTTTTETSTSIPDNASILHIGTLFPGNPVFDGLIDEVRFHRRALSASEIAAIENETDTFAPIVSTGTAPAASASIPASLSGVVTAEAGPTPTAAWTKVSGPGNVFFANAASPATNVTFSKGGAYLLRLTATNPNGEVSRTLAVTAAPNPAIFADWQAITWPGITDPGTIGPDVDPDSDGLSNLLEWALHLNAKAADLFTPTLILANNNIEFTYTRRKTAPGEATFTVEWSDTLKDDWSTDAVITSPPTSLTATSESVTALIPTNPAGRRLVRLKISNP